MPEVRPVSGTSSISGEAVDVVRAMVDAFNAHDVDAVLTYFADDCELTLRPAFPRMSNRTTHGKARPWAMQLIGSDFRIEIEVLEAEGNRVRTLTRTWQNVTRRIGLTPVVGIEDYVVEDGKITRLVWTSSEGTLERFTSIRTRFLIGVAVAVVLLLTLLRVLIR